VPGSPCGPGKPVLTVTVAGAGVEAASEAAV